MASLKQWMSTVASNISTHVGTLIGGGAVHGISGWGGAPEALGPAAATGDDTTIARGDHVHPTTGLLLTTDRGGTPVALGAAAAEGNATTVARSNHVHPYPTAANVGAMATSHAANAITGFAVPIGLGAAAAEGNATTVARSNHVHPTTGLLLTTDRGGTPVGLGAAAAEGNATTVARSNHVHPYPQAWGDGRYAALAGSLSQSFSIDTLTLNAASSNTSVEFKDGDTLRASITPYNSGSFDRMVFRNTNGFHFGALEAGVWADVYAGNLYQSGVLVAASTHVHGNLGNDGKIGTDANKPLITGTAGAITAGSFGTSANTFCQGNDSRLSDARTPTSHSHAIGDLPTPTSGTPAALGTASRGLATTLSRSDHVHPHTTGSINVDFYAQNFIVKGYGVFYNATDGIADSGVRPWDGRVEIIGSLVPVGNNQKRLGYSNLRWSEVHGGNFFVNGTQVASDVRLKKDVVQVARSRRALKAVADAGIIRYRMKDDQSEAPLRFGFDAEVIHAEIPEAASWIPRGLDEPEDAEQMRSVDLVALVAVIYQQMADLADRVEDLEARGGRP